MRRPASTLWIETDEGRLDAFQSATLVTDLFDGAQATIECGDDGAYEQIERIVAPGRLVRVYVDGFLQLSGRAECNEVPLSASSGSVVQLVVRTKMADARYATCDPRVRLKDASIADVVVAFYAQHGYERGDFKTSAAAERDLVTGKRKGAKDPVDLEPLKAQEAKSNPTEAVFEAVGRHLKRHHLMHWDAADGRILVGAPDDEQEPIAFLRCKRGARAADNNVLSARRVVDWGEVPGELWVYGGVGGGNVERATVKGVSADLDLARVAASNDHFRRLVVVAAEGAKTLEQATAAAHRERASRSRRKDAWEVECDGLSYWDGARLVPWAINTTVDVDVDVAQGRASGPYLVTRVERTLSASASGTSRLSLLARGVLVL